MNIEQVKSKRRQLGQDIYDLIRAFEDETDMVVDSVYVEHLATFGGRELLTTVEVDVKLEKCESASN